jgi:hypothetical protein
MSLLLGSAGALAGPWGDGMVAYNRGRYLPQSTCSRGQPGRNAKAGNEIAVMYRKGEGVQRSAIPTFM